MLHMGEETYLFEQVLKTALSWEGADHIMFVVGATQSNLMAVSYTHLDVYKRQEIYESHHDINIVSQICRMVLFCQKIF